MKIRARYIAAFIVLTSCTLAEANGRDHQHNALDSSTELIVVTTANWDAVRATLERYQRAKPGKEWVEVGRPVEVVVGKNGLGWGAGAIASESLGVRQDSDPVKKEGDGKAPAGIFSLSEAFGYPPEKIPGTKLPYLPLTSSIECVDDAGSKFYNRILDRASVSPDWNSSEHMLRSDELYRWGIVVDHNSNPPKSGAGSCIFLHIWRGPGQGTVGCTAMPQEQIEALLTWVDPARKPVLVQMPEQQYRRAEKKWKLPVLKAKALSSR